ncbi:hypothetical protein [Nocardiopsis prasina]|uniref:hypothetical protein n=1 Tax=Nocardiopsis prasina TaxID=2015 RepID=UPI00034975FA|nr:hypothetical protein [Nocardiopsis prasina]
MDSYSFRAEIAEEGQDWNKGEGLFGTGDSANADRNEALLLRAANLVGDFERAEITCANAINVGLAGRTDFVSEKDLDGAAPDPDQFVHGYGADLTELPTSWGEAAAGTDYGWVRDVGSAVWDFGVGAVEGVGAAVGAHSSQGWFAQSWGDSLKEYHWGNLTSAASLVGMYDAESDSLGWAGLSSAGQAWKDLAHSVVPWEEWGERPGYVIGTALLNIGATVGGAVLTATGVGAVVGVPLMAWRGAAILDGMGSSNRGGGGGGVDLPTLSTNASVTSHVSPGQMEVIKAYMDQLVNPVYSDTGDLAGGPSSGGVEGAGSGRVGTTNSAQGDGSATPASHRGSGEKRAATAEELRVFDEIIENDPQLKAQLEEYGPAFREHDAAPGDLGDGSWTGGAGNARQPSDGPVGEQSRSADPDVDPSHAQRIDLTESGEAGTGLRSEGQAPANESSRAPVAVLDRDGGATGDGAGGPNDDNGAQRTSEDGHRRTSSAGGTLLGGGSSSGGPGEPGHGSGPGHDRSDSQEQGGPHGDGSNSDRSQGSGHQGNPWDKEWNNDKLNERYRVPVVPEERRHKLEVGDSGPPSFPEEGARFADNQRLEPNSVWDVKGRGRFYSDGDGRISHIDTHPGNKVDANPELREEISLRDRFKNQNITRPW